MSGERKFIRENTNRILIKEFLIKKIEGAGFGGMTIQRTPMGTRINILVERPGMVIGKGGGKIKEITGQIREKFDVDNPQIEIQEAGSKASLNAQIMAEKLAEALERGWHFRRAGHSTVRRIMNAGARGCQVVIAGKLTGARHRTEKFTEGHIKYCGETAREVIIVTSGAIGMGASQLELASKTKDIKMRQACAAIGQPLLMHEYRKAFLRHGINVAQLLLTAEVFNNRSREFKIYDRRTNHVRGERGEPGPGLPDL